MKQPLSLLRGNTKSAAKCFALGSFVTYHIQIYSILFLKISTPPPPYKRVFWFEPTAPLELFPPPPTKGYFGLNPPPLWNFYFPLKIVLFDTPHHPPPLLEFRFQLPWGGFGKFIVTALLANQKPCLLSLYLVIKCHWPDMPIMSRSQQNLGTIWYFIAPSLFHFGGIMRLILFHHGYFGWTSCQNRTIFQPNLPDLPPK